MTFSVPAFGCLHSHCSPKPGKHRCRYADTGGQLKWAQSWAGVGSTVGIFGCPEPPGRMQRENWIKIWLDSFAAQLKPSAESQTCKCVANNPKINVLCSNGLWTICFHSVSICISENRGEKQEGKGGKYESKRLKKSQTEQSLSGILRALLESASQCTSNTVCGVTGAGNHHSEDSQRARSGLGDVKTVPEEHE